MTSDATPLSDKMRALADAGHPRADELREKAADLEAAVLEPFAARWVYGAWARARRLYCDCTGEPLV
jgi:hypothetical protein